MSDTTGHIHTLKQQLTLAKQQRARKIADLTQCDQEVRDCQQQIADLESSSASATAHGPGLSPLAEQMQTELADNWGGLR